MVGKWFWGGVGEWVCLQARRLVVGAWLRPFDVERVTHEHFSRFSTTSGQNDSYIYIRRGEARSALEGSRSDAASAVTHDGCRLGEPLCSLVFVGIFIRVCSHLTANWV